jgi:hypothetical protein
MPRHNYSKKHIPAQRLIPKKEQGKIRYDTKQLAEQAIRRAYVRDPDVELQAYQSPTDAGWYLTSR